MPARHVRRAKPAKLAPLPTRMRGPSARSARARLSMTQPRMPPSATTTLLPLPSTKGPAPASAASRAARASASASRTVT